MVLALAVFPGLTCAQVIRLDHMLALSVDSATPPSPSQPWETVQLPRHLAESKASTPSGPTWYAASFDAPADASERGTWAVYLPFFYDGGQVWLNGEFVGDVQESSAALQVRWERPFLVPLPARLLRAQDNHLAIRAGGAPDNALRHFPRTSIGPEAALLPMHDRRLFWVHTMPQITVVVCLLVSCFVLFIWWQRRGEVLYGLFGAAAALWGIRTLTFVIESVPMDLWLPWRITYLAATGGFIIVMALFAMRFAGIHKPRVEMALLVYWSIGPLWLAIVGRAGEAMVNRIWSAGLIPIGLSILGVSVWFMLRRRTLAATIMPAALVIAVLAGIHDYLVAWDSGALASFLPGWAEHRIFLLHHGANLLLLAMGGLLSARFIQVLNSLEELNQTLESRVADRERHLAANYARMATLQEQAAAAQERQLIMREIHDGLGSRLFTSLSRVERGDMDKGQIAAALRDCIADMRLALDALAPDAGDFRTVLGNFLFRWQAQLEEAHVRSNWTIDVPDNGLILSPQASLQLLRIAQEALTNVLKHARASHVQVSLCHKGGTLELEIVDNGLGETRSNGAGRGLENMRARARQMGGNFELQSDGRGTRVALRLPLEAVDSLSLA